MTSYRTRIEPQLSTWQDIWSAYNPIFFLLIGGLLLGYLLTGDYGKSLDEDHLMVYGRQTIQIYRGERESSDTIANLNFYGPAYSLLVEIGRFKLERLHPSWQDAEARHFSYYLTFLLALFFLYDLCLRFVPSGPAIAAIVLFASQPLIFGHAFINPKDIPFMAFFIGSVTLGFRAADRWYGRDLRIAPGQPESLLDRPEDRPRKRPNGRPSRAASSIWDIGLLVGASLVFGICTNVRVFGLLAGALVSLYMAARGRVRSIWALALYWGLALPVVYLTWPYLWGNPVGNFLTSLELMANFPTVWTYYQGQSFAPSTLPWYYLPHLVGIQLTIPALVLGAFGLYLLYRRGVRSLTAQLDRHLITLWVAAPIIYFIVARPHLYDNFRQLLFIVPPIFVLGSMGLAAVFAALQRPLYRALFLVLILLPGVLALIRLHPYQYVYYNALVGGVKGAFQSYPLDYWCTSSKEAMTYVNGIAPPNAIVRFNKKRDLIMPYARADLQIIGRYTASNGLSGSEAADLTITCLRGPKVLKDPDQALLWQVAREAVPLAVVTTRNP